MLPHEQPFLFRNTSMRLGYCADELEHTEWGDLQWESQEEEKASHEIREWCQRYIAAHDFLHGKKPDDK